MTLLRLDYETFSRCNLASAGLWAYAMHTSTRVLCLAYAVDNGEPSVWDASTPVPKKLLELLKDPSVRVTGWNSQFEYAITKYVGPRYKLPVPKLSRWRDTQATARMCAYPGRLEACAKALKLPEAFLKDKEGKRLIAKFSVPQRDGRRILPKEDPADFARMMAYCKQDVRVERAIDKALPAKELHPFELRMWRIDTLVNERGVGVDVAMAKGAQALADIARARAIAHLPRMTENKVTTLGQSKRILSWCASRGYPLPNLKKETVAAALEDENTPQEVLNLLELRASTNLTSVAKYKAILGAVCEDGRVRGVHAYGAATTLRWGGRIVQFQNLPRPSIKLDEIDHALIRGGRADALTLLYGNLMPVLRDALRNTVRAADGKILFVVDKASIEARVLGWCAQDPGYMKTYSKTSEQLKIEFAREFSKLTREEKASVIKNEREKIDHYCEMAGVIFDKKPILVTDDERWVGKGSILGQGYSMGANTFFETCKKNGRILPMELCKHTTNVYRETYYRIPEYWRECERAAIKAIEGTPTTLAHGIRFAMVNGALTIRLPSGRSLWYPGAKIVVKPDKFNKTKDRKTIRFMTTVKGSLWLPAETYGGRIVENIVQAISRDLLGEALWKCEDAGIPPVMHIHDEIVGEPEIGLHTLDEMHAIFRSPPAWAKGLPLGSGGFESPYYKK